jgi:hypothetical protein
MKRIILALFVFFSTISNAEIIQVSGPDGDTPTAYWGSPNSKAVLIFLPGGDGSFNIAAKNPPKPNWVLSNLYQVSQNSPGLDIVLMDSPYSLGMRGGNIAPRYTKDHLTRVLSVVNYYKSKLNKPIYVIGHSNGAISLSAFLNDSPNNQKLLSGAIFSGGRNETQINEPLNLPVLFLHHEDDANGRWTSYSNAKDLHKKVKVFNTSNTDFQTVHGGNTGGDPATSGHHMYEGSLDEAANHIWNFIFKANVTK